MSLPCPRSCGRDTLRSHGLPGHPVGQPDLPSGTFIVSSGDSFPARQIVANLTDLVNTGRHPNPRRLNGCCGLDGCDGRNRVCREGHEVGTERSDCWWAHAVHFDPGAVRMGAGPLSADPAWLAWRDGAVRRLAETIEEERAFDRLPVRYPGFVRTRSLKQLHAGVVQQFIGSPGFGVMRSVGRPAPFYLEHERKEMPPLPQPAPSIWPADLAPAPLQVASGPDLLAAHDENTVQFLAPLGFGYVRDREHVAGFRPHQFREGPRAPRRWQVSRLELVGLLKGEEPVVYLSAHFPRMDELREAPTRSLDAFETEALAKLRRGDDLIVQEADKQMRMLGSLRAAQQCLRCHQVQRGELLGAFSYQMLLGVEPSK